MPCSVYPGIKGWQDVFISILSMLPLLEAWDHLHLPCVYKQLTNEILYKSLQHLGILFMTLSTTLWRRICNF